MSVLSTRRNEVRVAAWCLLAFVVVAGVAFAVAGGGTLRFSNASDIFTYEMPMVIAVMLCLVLWVRGPSAHEKRFWGLLGAAVGFVLVAEAYWTWYAMTVDSSGPGLDNPVMAVYLVGAVVGSRLLYEMTGMGAESTWERMQFVLDVTAGSTAAFALVYLWWTLPLLGLVPGGGWQMSTLAAAYPVYGTLMIATSTSIISGWRSRRWKRWERLVAGSLAVAGVALFSFPFWMWAQLTGVGAGLSRYASSLGVAMALLCVAAVYRLSDLEGEALAEPWPASWTAPNSTVSRSYPVVLVVALLGLGFAAFETSPFDYGRPIAIAAVILAVLLALRSVVVSLEQAGSLQQVFTDPATGALNRNWLDSILRRRLADASSAGSVLSLVVFDVADEDRFNAVIGHSAGAAVLGRVARVLEEETPSSGEVFALSEYEFAVILPDTSGTDAGVFARRTWLRLSREATVEGRPLDIAAGVAVFPEHAADPQGLVAAAESALGASRGAEAEPVVMVGDIPEAVDAEDSVMKARMRALRSTVRALAEAVDARDPHTVDHSSNVSEWCNALTQVMDLDEDQAQVLGLAALVHDIGKVGVHDEVLLKATPLTPDERHEMELHTLLGERILAPTKIDNVLPIVRSHHERWDGFGYPDGLSGELIPLGARILAVCDAFDAMTSGRSYRPRLGVEEALRELGDGAGSQFDPEIVEKFARLVRNLDAAWASQPLPIGQSGLPSTS